VGLAGLHNEGLVDVWDDTTTGDGGLNEGIKLLVTADSKLQVAGSDALNFEVLAGIACKLKHLSGEVLKNSCGVDS